MTPDQQRRDTDTEARRAELFAKRTKSRLAIVERLDSEDREEIADRLRACGTELRLRCKCCNTLRIVRQRCDNKWCPNCAPLIAHRVTTRLVPLAAAMRNPLYVTWTVKNWSDRVGLRELRQAFSKLIKLRWFKRACIGGCAGFEVSRLTEKERRKQKLGPRDGLGWHPHAHALMDCRWLGVSVLRPAPGCSKEVWKSRVRAALAEVADQWSLALGRRGTVKVRATFHCDGGDPTRGLKETIKYSVTSDVLENTEEPIAPLIDDLILTRNLTTFGYFHNHPLLKRVRGEPVPCEVCGETGTLMPAAMVEAFIAKTNHSSADEKKRITAECKRITDRTRRQMRGLSE